MSKQRRLGRGLDALLAARPREKEAPAAAAVAEVPIDRLRPGPYQPRGQIADGALAELADSIREQGVLQPLVVRPLADASGDADNEIVAGERRWRAARLAGLTTVPVIVRELDDQDALAVALIENLQREDLNPIDQARSLARLAGEFGLTHEQAAQAVGRSRASVTNLLRLLDLEEEVKEMLAQGTIDMGHARALLPLDAERQVALARKTAERKLSVREVEQAVRTMTSKGTPEAPERPVDLQTRWLQQQMGKELGHKLAIRPARDGGYALRIAFADLGQLHVALERLQALVEQVRATAGPRARNAGGGGD